MDINGSFRGQSINEQCEIPVWIKLVACDRCSRMAGKYFQSTVQLRGNNIRSMSAQEIVECKKIARSMADSGYHGGDQLSFIQEMKEVKGGLDIILGSTQLGRRMARVFQERFGGRLLETCKLVGKKDSRDVYRSTLVGPVPEIEARRYCILPRVTLLCVRIRRQDNANNLTSRGSPVQHERRKLRGRGDPGK